MVQFVPRAIDFSVLRNIHTDSEAHRPPIKCALVVLSARVKRTASQGDDSQSYSTEVKYMCRFTCRCREIRRYIPYLHSDDVSNTSEINKHDSDDDGNF